AGQTFDHDPPEVECPVCDATFSDGVAVSWHVNDVHPLERPIMLLDGAAIPSRTVYAVALDGGAISFANTTAIRATINGQTLVDATVDNVAARLAQERRAVFQIEIENNRAEDEAKVAALYTVITAIPDEAELEAVDQLFLHHLAIESPTHSDVRAFAD